VPKRADIIKKLREELDPERFEHSLRVEKTAAALARRFKVAVHKARIAGLLHDCSRKYNRAQMLTAARRLKLKIDPVSEFEPKLLHAQLSAHLAKKNFGVNSTEILGAIRRHTVGAPAMSKLDKIIYLADHIEEGRDFSGVNKVRSLAKKDLNRAVIESTSNMLKFLLAKGLPIHPGTIETRNYYLLKA
jgi:predicted HD superfamily hydrolase involved in NAD metabolism